MNSFFFIVGQKISSNLNQICKDKDYSLGLALISQEPFKLCYNCLTLEMPISRLSYPFPGSNSQLIFSFPFFFLLNFPRYYKFVKVSSVFTLFWGLLVSLLYCPSGYTQKPQTLICLKPGAQKIHPRYLVIFLYESNRQMSPACVFSIPL